MNSGSIFAVIALTAALPLHSATLAGTVLEDPNGSPVASANVQVSQPGELYLAADLETNREGKFHAEGLPAGSYHLKIIKPGHQTTETDVTLTDDAPANPVTRIVRLGVISGRVTDGTGMPVTGARVFAVPRPPGGQPIQVHSRLNPAMAAVDADGNYRIYNLPEGEYVVAVTYGDSTTAVGSSGMSATRNGLGSGYQLYPANSRPDFLVISSGTEHRNVDFTLLEGARYSIRGKVTNYTERTFFWLALLNPQQPSLAVAVAPSDPKDGTFRFNGVPSGTYRLVGSKTSGGRAFFGALLDQQDPVFVRTTVSVAGADMEGLDVTLDEVRTATLDLMPGEGCETEASFVMHGLEDWGTLTQRTVKVTQGMPLEVSGLAPMQYVIDSTATSADADCFLESETVIDLEDGDATAALHTYPAGSVAGQVNASGDPGSFTVVLLPIDQEQPQVRYQRPGSESAFRFETVKPGRYRVAAVPDDGARRVGSLPPLEQMTAVEVRAGSAVQVDLIAPQR